ncbi:MAG: signal recognition particle-docking protein FtsY, partial [Caldiserica bacterium]
KVTESILVLDSTDGENLYSQVENFKEVSKVSSLFITKLDSTIKPGVIIPIYVKYKIPITYLFTGEDINDFSPFDPVEFVNSILNPYFSS